MLEGSLDKELQEKWSWDRTWPTAQEAGFADYPEVEMKTLMGGEARL